MKPKPADDRNTTRTMEASEATALKSLLSNQPVAALATLHKGEPAISMVPFAMLPCGTGFVIHVSRLAAHTNDMLTKPDVALLVTAPLTVGQSPLALPRISIQCRARQCTPESAEYAPARDAYLTKLPDAEDLFSFADFSLFIIEADTARYVAGFGRALSLTAERLQAAMALQP
jgi:heme iron utilization protein